jgi:DNA polymerase-3 subunit beta
MKFSAEREQILGPLQAVMGVVERRQTMPILANVLVVVRDGTFSVTATDLEVELVARGQVTVDRDGEITVPGRKFLDIIKALPSGLPVNVALESEKVVVKCGRSRFTLSSLPASEYPTVEEINQTQTLSLSQSDLKRLLEKCSFSMAHQDVRYYLNGLLLETDGKMIRTVATDGHRLALCELELAQPSSSTTAEQVIVPRKGVLELTRLIGGDGQVLVQIGSNHIRVQINDIRFTSKLIDGRFPEYGRVIPANPKYVLKSGREELRGALQRMAILSNEKYRGIRLALGTNLLTLQAHNPEQEEAEEELEVAFDGVGFEVGFNVNYLLDALAAIDGAEVELGLTDANSSCLVRAPGSPAQRYVVMPMRL